MIFTGESEWYGWVLDHGEANVLEINDPGLLPPGLKEALEFETFSVFFPNDPSVRASVAVANDDGSVDLRINAGLISESTSEAGIIRRVIKTGRTVEHSLFSLPKQFWNTGNARKMLRHAVDLYDQLEIETVSLQADGLGKYIWAASGFDFADDETREVVNVALRLFAEELELFEQPLPEFRHPWDFMALDFDDNDDPVYVSAETLGRALERRGEVRLIEGLKPGKMVPSKALLLYSRYDYWDGILNLNFSSESRRQLDNYL